MTSGLDRRDDAARSDGTTPWVQSWRSDPTGGSFGSMVRPLVLAVDDDPVQRELLGVVLERAGFDVALAADAEQALRLATTGCPDLVVTDAVMPRTTGLELIEHMRRRLGHARVPAIVISGTADIEARIRAFDTGAADFLAKPFDPQELVARVNAQLRTARQWTDHARAMVEEIRDVHPDPGRARGAGTVGAAGRVLVDRIIADADYRFAFQPIVTMGALRVVGYEALARFGAGIDTLDLLDVAGQAGRRVALELALLEGALGAASVFPEGTWIHVNVSPLAAMAPELPEIVAAAHSHVVLEITENALFDADGANHLRASLPENCRLAIDDVGAGYAGLSRLIDLRPDIIKIDRSMIAGIHADPARQALVAGLVTFGEVTDAMVIAEGIELADERDMLRELGVRFAQGYLFARPGSPIVAAMRVGAHAAGAVPGDVQPGM